MRLGMVLFCVFSLQAAAAEPVETQQQVGADKQAVDANKQDDALSFLDAPRTYVSQEFVDMVKGIDHFFGSERNYQESNNSVLQLDLTRVTGYGGDRKVVLSGRANVRLPNTEKRLHLLIESDPDKNINAETRPALVVPVQNTQAPSSYAAAVRIEKAQENRWLFSADGGLKFQGLNTHLFTRARASYSAPLDGWNMKFSETPFWFNNLGVGASTQLDLERALDASMLFRASSYATWLQDKKNFDLRQDLSVFHTLDERTALLYQASAIGVSRPQLQSSDFILAMLYRYRLHQKWMYFDVSPQMHYPQARNYRPSPALSLRLEVLFDKSN